MKRESQTELAQTLTSNGSPARRRLQALTERKATVDAALRVEKQKQKAAEAKRQARVDFLVGHVLRNYAARDPAFAATLKELLQTAAASLDQGCRNFLKSNGYL